MEFELKAIKQRHLEQWSESFQAAEHVSKTKETGDAVRLAVEAEWFAAPATEFKPGDGNGTQPQHLINGVDVGDLEGWEVIELCAAILDKYDEARTIPKN